MNIVLIGFMGCGKTTVGRRLASKLNLDFVDTDKYIEEKENKKISDIFSEKGELFFRDLETDTIRSMINSIDNSVISTGGGIILRSENVDILHQIGTVIYIKASREELLNRLKYDKSRPLLQSGNLEEKIDNLLSQRWNLYENASDYILDSDGKTIENIINEIEVYIDETVGS